MATVAPPHDLAEIPDGTPLAEIAAHYGVPLAIARRWVMAEVLPPVTRRPGGPPRRYDTTRIVKLYAQGRTEVEVAAEVGCGGSTVSKYVREAGLSRGRAPRLDTAEIVRRYQAGQSLSEVAAAVGASISGVWRVLVQAGVPRRPR